MAMAQMIDPSITFDIILPSLHTPNLRQFLNEVSGIVAPFIGINERILAERLAEKQKQTPPAIGRGAAILDLQMSGLRNPFMLYARMKSPLHMETPDAHAVDIFSIILTPEREGSLYLPQMARLSRMLQDEGTAALLRAATDERSVRAVFERAPMQKQAA
jgi:PTS system nitrogen regulatory IIA component